MARSAAKVRPFQTVISKEQCLSSPPPPKSPGDLILGTPEGRLPAKHLRKASGTKRLSWGSWKQPP